MRSVNLFRVLTPAGLVVLTTILCTFNSNAQKLGNGLIVVSPDKLPSETRQPSVAMTLRLVGPQTLYLYVEEQDIRKLAVYDVTDPTRIKLKKIAQLNAASPYDFVMSASPFLELIRYRQSGHLAMLDLSKPKDPILSELGSTSLRTYIIPREINSCPTLPTDYSVFAASNPQPLWSAKGVLQEVFDSGNGTTYLLSADGLTEIRDVQAERRLAASAPHWTNTIDDN